MTEHDADALISFDFVRSFPHKTWVSGWSTDESYPHGFRGFEVAHAGRHDEEARWSLDLTARSLPTMEAIEQQSMEIEEIVEAAEADYDG